MGIDHDTEMNPPHAGNAIAEHPYSHERIQAYLKDHLHLHYDGDHEALIRRSIEDMMYNLPNWAQVICVANNLELEIGDRENLEEMDKGAAGDFSSQHNKARSLGYRGKNPAQVTGQIKRIMAHEIGHAIDSYFGAYVSDNNLFENPYSYVSRIPHHPTWPEIMPVPTWSESLDLQKFYPNHEFPHLPNLKGIVAHLETKRLVDGELKPFYHESEHPSEAFAEFSAAYFLLHDRHKNDEGKGVLGHKGDFRALCEESLGTGAEHLWHHYRDVFLPLIEQKAIEVHQENLSAKAHRGRMMMKAATEGAQRMGCSPPSQEVIDAIMDRPPSMRGMFERLFRYASAYNPESPLVESICCITFDAGYENKMVRNMLNDDKELRETVEALIHDTPEIARHGGMDGLVYVTGKIVDRMQMLAPQYEGEDIERGKPESYTR
ncbi:MAG: hypothetical protein MRY32_05775 [Rickettsiales bacterium]|nr:hypothetical protein [Rickettsiales bacterium]